MRTARWWVLNPWTKEATVATDPALALALFGDSGVYGVLRLAEGEELAHDGWFVVSPPMTTMTKGDTGDAQRSPPEEDRSPAQAAA